ncbi:MAG: DUF3467 domain-containing protein [Phycisphaerae bacterium]|nr:DUF3467 domain-containing protein [Phycisphaerae bacterium]
MAESKEADQVQTEPQQRVQVRIDQRDMTTTYGNAFQSNATPDEVFLSFGINQAMPAQQEGADPEVLLKIESRIVMNWQTIKRLAIQLSQMVRAHEQQFGELELDINKRIKAPKE